MPTPAQAREARQWRFRAMVTLVVAGFAIIVFALLRLQVVEHRQYAELAKENRVRLEVIRAPRGAIYDRHGELLADSAPSFSIVFRPFPAESVEAARATSGLDYLSRVAALVGIDTAEVRLRLRTANRTGQTAVLRRDAPFPVLAAVEETRSELPGIEVLKEPLRRYAQGAIAGHVLGYAGEINDVELDSLTAAGYRSGDLIGRSGVERRYEDVLRGIDGAEYVVVNARGKRVAAYEQEPRREPVPGHDLVLTLDMRVQRAMEQAMSGVARGAGVAIDPRDGSILAMVSRPGINPNEFSRGISFARWGALTRDGSNPLLNRAIQGLYPPGSTFKIVSMASCMSDAVASPGTRLQPCTGSYMYGGRSFGCWNRNGHGTLDFIGALQFSCDVYFYQLGPALGLPRLANAARELGLGDRTGIDLPQERRGLVPDEAWYDKRQGANKFRKSLLLNLIIGQGELLCTPLQLALMTAEVAMDGRALRPHVVREVRGERGLDPERPDRPGMNAKPAVWNALHKAMELVVSAGTASAARVPGMRVAGKTGTAQNPHGKDHALFVCYAPMDKPEIAIAIVVENSGHGGTVAAPVAGNMLRKLYLPDSLQKVLAVTHPIRVDTTAVDTTGALGAD